MLVLTVSSIIFIELRSDVINCTVSAGGEATVSQASRVISKNRQYFQKWNPVPCYHKDIEPFGLQFLTPKPLALQLD